MKITGIDIDYYKEQVIRNNKSSKEQLATTLSLAMLYIGKTISMNEFIKFSEQFLYKYFEEKERELKNDLSNNISV